MKYIIKVEKLKDCPNDCRYNVFLKDNNSDKINKRAFIVNGNEYFGASTISEIAENVNVLMDVNTTLDKLILLNVLAAHNKLEITKDNLKNLLGYFNIIIDEELDFNVVDGYYVFDVSEVKDLSKPKIDVEVLDNKFKELIETFKTSWNIPSKEPSIINLEKMYAKTDSIYAKCFILGMLSSTTTHCIASNYLSSFMTMQELDL